MIASWISLHADASGGERNHMNTVQVIGDRLTEALEVRNALCHGLLSVTGDPRTGEAWVKTNFKGKAVIHYFGELHQIIVHLEIAAHFIPDLTNLVGEPNLKDGPAIYARILPKLLSWSPTSPPTPASADHPPTPKHMQEALQQVVIIPVGRQAAPEVSEMPQFMPSWFGGCLGLW